MVNLPTAGVDYHVPFGGCKASSYGPREQGLYAQEFFTTVKRPTRWPEGQRCRIPACLLSENATAIAIVGPRLRIGSSHSRKRSSAES